MTSASTNLLATADDPLAQSAPVRIAILAVGTGNLGSVINALTHLGSSPILIDDPNALGDARGIVLPGVGSFADGMQRLRSGGWVEPLRAAVTSTPILGICLGMQLLAERGVEGGDTEGLGLVPGTVERLPASPGVRIPHVGWNDVEMIAPSRLIEPSKSPRAFYFVHSYALSADTPGVTGVTHHGSTFAATIEHGNAFGTQFHPEKSHKSGLALLTNFLEVCRRPC
ncbi:MAG: imidazole glycerol phosphate synthase subunit HisH [Acidimicrobiia bacterium]